MDLDKAREFIRNNHRAVMLTWNPSGRPQTSPVGVGIDADGRPLISTAETAVKTRNLRANPNLTLCVTTDAFIGEWIQIDGTAEVLSVPEAVEPLVEYYRSISGEHPDWDDFRAAMVRDRHVLIRVDITRAGPDIRG
ncbi:PPOX class F420-dependent oxidoreductase [Sphaerisporangium sp. NPDC049002]|uniref:PPOX class F420-dependent oxidoreductase n=1 Tax=unclassified Sphaerisporangium TaxID=2630420 RepID=UPI003408CBC8